MSTSRFMWSLHGSHPPYVGQVLLSTLTLRRPLTLIPLLIRSAWRKPPMAAPRREIVLPRAAYILGAILLGGYVVYWLRDVLTPCQRLLKKGPFR
jgi:hypothetical protein